MTIHNAILEVGGEVFHFSSLDGEEWVPVTRPGLEGEEDHTAAILAGDGTFKPPTYPRAHLEEQGALFMKSDSTEVQHG